METIKPHLSGWNFAELERELFTEADKIPTWRLANQSRRLLADVVRQLWVRVEAPTNPLVTAIEAETARQLAALQLGSIVVRSTSAQTALVSCGYEADALSHARTSLEALLRTRQILDETSGDSARRILIGRRAGSLKTIAHRYGSKHEVELLDHFSHADVRTLVPLSQPVTAHEGILELRPTRGKLAPAAQLLEAARVAVLEATAACRLFGVTLEVNRWIGAQLQHYRDNPLPSNI